VTAGPLPEPPAEPAAPAGGTPGYLPQRRPGGLLLNNGAGTDEADGGQRPPDPELIRARLAGLASGMAAAARYTRGGAVPPAPWLAPDPDPTPNQDGAR
jgi:hypothetical protein